MPQFISKILSPFGISSSRTLSQQRTVAISGISACLILYLTTHSSSLISSNYSGDLLDIPWSILAAAFLGVFLPQRRIYIYSPPPHKKIAPKNNSTIRSHQIFYQSSVPTAVWLFVSLTLLDMRRMLRLSFGKILLLSNIQQHAAFATVSNLPIIANPLFTRATAALGAGCLFPTLALGWLIMHSVSSFFSHPRTSKRLQRLIALSLISFSILFADRMPFVAAYLRRLIFEVCFPWPTCTMSGASSIGAASAALALAPLYYQSYVAAASAALIAAAVTEMRRCISCPSPDTSFKTNFTDASTSHFLSSDFRDATNKTFPLVWSCQLKHGGSISVIRGSMKFDDRSPLQYRVMKLGHSIMGGEWIDPGGGGGGQPIYSAFLMQSAAWMFLPTPETPLSTHIEDKPEQEQGEQHTRAETSSSIHTVDTRKSDKKKRSLHIGLGIGSAVVALQKKGFVADIIEIHREVITAATQLFGISLQEGMVMHGDAGHIIESMLIGRDAHKGDTTRVPKHEEEEEEIEYTATEKNESLSPVYDVIILDVFSGSKKPSKNTLETEMFFARLKMLLKLQSGVLAVNFYGMQGKSLYTLACRLANVFDGNVRLFHDDDNDSGDQARVKNFILFASNIQGFMTKDIQHVIDTVVVDDHTNDFEREVFAGFAKREIFTGLSSLDDMCSTQRLLGLDTDTSVDDREWRKVAVSHWIAMRKQFGDAFFVHIL